MTLGECVTRDRKFYRADDNPQWPLAILFGFQQVMVCVSALIVIPFILSNKLCAGEQVYELRVRLISSTFVASGLSTIIQTGLGMRLSLLQGTAFAYVPSVLAFLELPENACNFSIVGEELTHVYENKMALIQGCLLLSALVPMFIGFSGLVGMLTKFVGPITVTPLILLLVISAVSICLEKMEKHWVSLIQVAALFATILYLADVKVPIPFVKNRRFFWYRVAIFGEYPYLIAILFSWGTCFLLTLMNLVDGEARTDKNASISTIVNSPWIRVPYPGLFGLPQFNYGLWLAFIVSAMTSVFESIGDYHAIARVSHECSPPSHAMNRGILAEGAGSFISGLIGPGIGLTTHTENIGVISVTQVASRRTLLIAGTILIGLGVFTKIGAILSTIPEPLVGGVLAGSMAMVGGVALANTHSVDLSNTRNISILGVSIMIGVLLPTFKERYEGYDLANKRQLRLFANETINQVARVLMGLHMFVGGLCACILDNTVPGATRRQRGLRDRGTPREVDENGRDVYALPAPLMHFIARFQVDSESTVNRCVAKLLAVLPIIPRPKTLQRIGRRVGDASMDGHERQAGEVATSNSDKAGSGTGNDANIDNNVA